MTFWVARRIKSLFSDYFIDSSTDIMLNEFIDSKHPFRIYLDMLRSHISFKLRTVTLSQMIGRIHYYLTGRSSSKRKFSVVWRKILEREACPWITKPVDYALQNKAPTMQHVAKMMRLGMFYMVVKNYLYNRKQRSDMKRKTKNSIDASSNSVE